MPLHIIIDGYNLIRQSSQLSAIDHRDLQQGREALVDLLAAYRQVKPHPVTVVFDAADAVGQHQQRDRVQGIRIRFSAPGESADAVIKRMAARYREKAIIVSSDRDIAAASEAHGAAVIASPDFERKLVGTLYEGSPGDAGEDEHTGWAPTTRKKGPRRRRSKKARRHQRKIRKL